MARGPRHNRRFAKPIVMHDGAQLVSLADAEKFLNNLRREDITAPVYYAGSLLHAAIEHGGAGEVERVRLELIRAFRGEGWL